MRLAARILLGLALRSSSNKPPKVQDLLPDDEEVPWGAVASSNALTRRRALFRSLPATPPGAAKADSY